MTYRTFSYWWGSQNPTKLGIKINWQNYINLGITSEQYFRDYIFSGTFYNYADAAPRHGVLPYFMDNAYEYDAGWEQNNWKEAMYIPCLVDCRTTSPHMPHFTNKILISYIDDPGGPYGAGVSNKLVQIGNQTNSWLTSEASNATPQQLFDTVKALRQSLKNAKPTNTPQLLWIGPNIYYQYLGLTGGDAWRNGPTWMDAWDNLVYSDPNMLPTIFGFCIHAYSAADYQVFFNEIAAYMTQWPTKNFRIVDATSFATDLNTQIAVMDTAMNCMDGNAQCKGTYWRFASNEFGFVNCPWPLANSTGYPPTGHFPWPFAFNSLGVHWNVIWPGRYDIYNPNNAPAQMVQPYPIDNP